MKRTFHSTPKKPEQPKKEVKPEQPAKEDKKKESGEPYDEALELVLEEDEPILNPDEE